jgi:hypothetical protein
MQAGFKGPLPGKSFPHNTTELNQKNIKIYLHIYTDESTMSEVEFKFIHNPFIIHSQSINAF